MSLLSGSLDSELGLWGWPHQGPCLSDLQFSSWLWLKHPAYQGYLERGEGGAGREMNGAGEWCVYHEELQDGWRC